MSKLTVFSSKKPQKLQNVQIGAMAGCRKKLAGVFCARPAQKIPGEGIV